MPEVDGKKFEYTEEGKKAAAAAKKRKGKSGDSWVSKYLAMTPGDKDKYAKGRERQDEIDRGERFVGKETGTIDTSKGKAEAKKRAKGVRRAGEYMQADEKLDDELWNQRTVLRDLQMAVVDVEGKESKQELQAAIDSIRRRTERPQRKLDRKYPMSAQHKKDVHRRKAESGE